MAFTAVVAIAGGAEVTAAVALAAVAEVGTAMTVVGMVTGNKTLMKVGGVMGLVGGIGGMVAGAGSGAMDAAAASDAGNGMSAAQAGSSAGEVATDVAGDAMSNAASSDAGNLGSNLNGADSGVVGSEVAPSVAQTAPVTQSVVTPTTPGATAPVTQAPTAVTDVANQSGNLGPQGVTGPAAPNTPFESGFTPVNNNISGAPQSSSSFLKGFMDFANNNKTLINSGTQILGGALKGMADQNMFDQKMGLARDQFNRANSVGTWAPTTGIIGRATA